MSDYEYLGSCVTVQKDYINKYASRERQNQEKGRICKDVSTAERKGVFSF